MCQRKVPQWLASFLNRRRPASSAHVPWFRPALERLEDKIAPAPLTGGTGPGGFVLASGGSSILQLWLDASAASTVVLSGGTVSQWSDRSGNGFNATAPNAPAQPMYNLTALNNQPAIRFSGNPTLLLVSPSLMVSRPYTIYTVDQYWANTDPFGNPSHGRSVTSNTGGTNWLTGKWNGENVHYAEGWVSTTPNLPPTLNRWSATPSATRRPTAATITATAWT
jgi:hypothetical protein